MTKRNLERRVERLEQAILAAQGIRLPESMVGKQPRLRQFPARRRIKAKDAQQISDAQKSIETALKQIIGVEPTRVRAWWREYARRHGSPGQDELIGLSKK